jgi:transcriptional regulator with XRE-family HTH domain
MYERRISARKLAEGTHLSASLCEKLAANRRRPSSSSIQKIEAFLNTPVWSTRAEFRRARAQSFPVADEGGLKSKRVSRAACNAAIKNIASNPEARTSFVGALQ